ncbi:MAG: nucleotidyl transferase AbiEii/AbiGii toxin family protein [Treponema sp.]|nr:nucleotidyl transferase AbiEii/AbiGii toxin family protein [Treponema sp.]
MLHEGCVPKELLALLRKLKKEPIFNDFFLVGGTALALQIGHRTSVDIDLFSKNKLRINEIDGYLNQNHSTLYQLLNSQNMIYQVLIEGIKVDFVEHPFELVEPVYYEKEIAYLGKKDIAAMKLHAIETTGNRAKDFIDIYFLLKEITLEEMFECYRKKYSTDNIFNAKRSLSFFDDVPEEGWAEVQIVEQEIKVPVIKSAILSAIQEYNGKCCIHVDRGR